MDWEGVRRMKKIICMISLVLGLTLLLISTGLCESRTYPVSRRLVVGCKGEDVYNVVSKLYEFGYLPKAPTGDLEDIVYTAAIAKVVQKYETDYYVDPATVEPPADPAPELTAPTAFVETVDGELTQDEQTAFLRMIPEINGPQKLTVTAKNGEINLSWEGVKSILCYNVYRNGALVETTTATKFTDKGLLQGKEYAYSIGSESFSVEGICEEKTVFLDMFYRKVPYKALLRSQDEYMDENVQFSGLRVVSQKDVENSNDVYVVAVQNKSPLYLFIPGFKVATWPEKDTPITKLLEGDQIYIEGQYTGIREMDYDKKKVAAPCITVSYIGVTPR